MNKEMKYEDIFLKRSDGNLEVRFQIQLGDQVIKPGPGFPAKTKFGNFDVGDSVGHVFVIKQGQIAHILKRVEG
jgi:hypothetical protein